MMAALLRLRLRLRARGSLVVLLAIVLSGCLFAISTAKEEATKLGTVIGIDLGTTYSCVGVYKNGHVEIIANDQGNRITPSWVGFTDSERLIGEAAKNQAAVNAERTIFDVKRLIGRKFNDKEVQRDMKLVPYKIVNKDGKPYIEVKVKDGETKVFEGERSLTKDCRLLGNFDLTGIPPAPRGTPQIEVTFEVDANGILNVKAEEKGARISQTITITNDKGRLSQEEIDRMVREAEEFAEEDKKVKERVDARNSLETYLYNMKNQITDKDKLADKLQSDEKEKVEAAVKEALEWLDDNQSSDKEDYEEKLKEVEALCNPIITAVYQRSGGASASTGEEDSRDEL
ncbi:hypothetical protein V6N13_109597 [Hibiscus sabdariffa]